MATIKGITHAGVFHGDEVMATAILSLIYGDDFTVERVNRVDPDLSDNTQGVIIYDIGGGRFDHHQKGGNGARENDVPYASAGLIWYAYGHLLVDTDQEFESIDKLLIQGIDAIDTGYGKPDGFATVSNIISSYNPNWDEDVAADDRFKEAVEFAKGVLKRYIAEAKSVTAAEDVLVEAMEKRTRKEILVLDKFVPWQTHLFNLQGNEEVLFVIFPSARGGYMIQCVPTTPGGFDQRLPLPESWRGLPMRDLVTISGISDITFVHPAGFCAAAECVESCIQIAASTIAMA